MSVPTTIREYIAGFPKDVQPVLKKLHATIRTAVPAADESISYRIPTFKVNGKPVAYFAGFKAHVSLFPVTAAVKEKFEKELSPYKMSTGTVRFPLDEPIPYALIGKIVKFMAQEKRKPAKAARRKPKK